MLMRWFRAALAALGGLLLLVTALPLLQGNSWWVRVWDFPRVQVAALLVVVGVAAVAVFGVRRPAPAAFLAALLAATAHQAWWILPYTPLHAVEAVHAERCEDASTLRLLTANVLVGNQRVGPLLEMVGRVDPDVLLLLETDAWWDRNLAPLKAGYPHVVARPREDGYGMHLFSKLRLVDPKVLYLIDGYVPSIETGLETRSGTVVALYGVHPAPPPLQDTARRDAELMIVALEVLRGDARPAIVMGDLNDVAWSATTRLFQKVGGLLDLRVGRGIFPTFHADRPLLRWPLDHVLFDRSFTLLEAEVMPDIGSDHFPFFAALCRQPGVVAAQDGPDAEPEDLRRAEEAIRAGREKARALRRAVSQVRPRVPGTVGLRPGPPRPCRRGRNRRKSCDRVFSAERSSPSASPSRRPGRRRRT